MHTVLMLNLKVWSFNLTINAFLYKLQNLWALFDISHNDFHCFEAELPTTIFPSNLIFKA